MRFAKIAFIGTALGATLIFGIKHFGPNGFEGVSGTALAAHVTDTGQSAFFVTDPITPAENASEDKTSGGPIRTVDW